MLLDICMMSNIELLLILNSIGSCHAKKVQLLLDAVGELSVLCREETLRHIEHTTPWGKQFVRSFRLACKRFDPHKELQELEKESIRIISFQDSLYPAQLKEIYDPPILLYVKGDPACWQVPCISIVGSRNASRYGRDIAASYAAELASYGISVVSGLARGIDAAAHSGALRIEGHTVAVLGSGVNVIYPPNNKALYESICHSGAVISEYPLNTEPYHYNFPKRNRIISGLSCGTVVVEAAERSGSLITARLALDEGREVYSVPGHADSFRSSGTHRLIKEGATLITSAKDIVDDLPAFLLNPKKMDRQIHALSINSDNLEQIVLSHINEQPMSLSTLQDECAISTDLMYTVLTQLEITHQIKRVMGHCYVTADNR